MKKPSKKIEINLGADSRLTPEKKKQGLKTYMARQIAIQPSKNINKK
ncbi:MAG: hypothetical protein ACKVJK_13335 [Methylophagaceae bacterium]|tara:strand:- start:187 stop:327 length:141 start_codon:yes stop_codon:yes gene_type:complete